RLAGAVVAEQAEHLAAPHRQRHVVERDHRPEELAGVAQLDQRHVRSGVHQRASVTLRRMKLFTSTASSTMMPMNTLHQSVSTPVRRIPIGPGPKTGARRAAPIAER